jgi:hypothetical protein
VGFCTSSPQQGVKYQLWYLILFYGGGVSINIPWKIFQGRQSSWPLGVSVKGIARAFNRLKCLCGFLHLKPTIGCQISTLIFEEKNYGGGSLWISHEKYIKDGKVLAHLGFQSKVFSGSLTDLSDWVGFCTSSQQQVVKYQLLYLIFFYEGGSIWISHEKYIKDGKVLDHLGLKSMVLPGPLTDLSDWVGFCTSSPQ